MKIFVGKVLITSVITFTFLICMFLVNSNVSYASSINTPEIESFSKSDIEANALKVEIKANNTGNDFSFELYNVTTNKKNNLAGSATTYTYQNLEAGKEYKVKIRACSNSANTYICSDWSSANTAIAGAIPNPNPDNPNPAELKGVKSVALSKTSYTYNGKAKKPSVKVIDNDGKTLTLNTDYTVKYADGRINIGTYKVIVTGKGDYSFNKELSFKIKLATPFIERLMPTEDRIDVGIVYITNQVSKDAGYQIAYKKSSAKSWTKFKYNGIIPKNSPKKKLAASTKYNIKIRAYNTIEGKKVYSSWSGIVTYKTLSKSNKYDLQKLEVSIKNYSNKYTGKKIKPKVTVKDYKTKKTLKKGTDYTLTYPSNPKKVGSYKITIKGKGKYAKNYPQYLRYKIVK